MAGKAGTDERKSEQVFSKAAWLKSANEQKDRGELNDREINDALVIWVNALDGKTRAEIERDGGQTALRDEWFVDKTEG